MRLVRFLKGGQTLWGHLDGERIGTLTGDPLGEFARGPLKWALNEGTLRAPFAPGAPSKIVGVINNFADRVREAGLPAPGLPAIFLKPPSSIIGPDEAIVLPPQSEHVEHGAELAVVIRKQARWVAPEEALKYVLGYTAANDVTARDLIEQDGLWARATGFDTFCALGPCIATGLDPADVMITCAVNGETRQMSSTRDLLFTVEQLIAFISSVMTLLPGDVILTGTPGGAGRLADGDVVEVEIEGVGVLRNPVITVKGKEDNDGPETRSLD